MDFSYTETQDMIRETLSRFLADTYDFDSRSKMIASSSGRDPGIWKALAQDLGMLGAIQTRNDQTERDLRTCSLVAAERGSALPIANCPSPTSPKRKR